MQRIKISQHPENGSLDTSVEPSLEAPQSAQTIAAAYATPSRRRAPTAGRTTPSLDRS